MKKIIQIILLFTAITYAENIKVLSTYIDSDRYVNVILVSENNIGENSIEIINKENNISKFRVSFILNLNTSTNIKLGKLISDIRLEITKNDLYEYIKNDNEINRNISKNIRKKYQGINYLEIKIQYIKVKENNVKLVKKLVKDLK